MIRLKMRPLERIPLVLEIFKNEKILRHFLGIKKLPWYKKIFSKKVDYIKQIYLLWDNITEKWTKSQDLRFGQLLWICLEN